MAVPSAGKPVLYSTDIIQPQDSELEEIIAPPSGAQRELWRGHILLVVWLSYFGLALCLILCGRHGFRPMTL